MRVLYEYDVETNEGYIIIYASNRNQARHKAEKKGYFVRSINMIGQIRERA